jgi:hypothetical protein
MRVGDFALRDFALLRSRPAFVCAACAGPLDLSLVYSLFWLRSAADGSRLLGVAQNGGEPKIIIVLEMSLAAR